MLKERLRSVVTNLTTSVVVETLDASVADPTGVDLCATKANKGLYLFAVVLC